MTVEKRDWLKRNLISFTNLALLVGLVVNTAFWKQRVDDDIIYLREHINSNSLHMPLEEKIKIFTTRNEFNQLNNKIDMINEKVDLLLRNELK